MGYYRCGNIGMKLLGNKIVDKYAAVYNSGISYYGKHLDDISGIANRIIDGKRDNISFAMSMRLLSKFHQGPIVRLRKSSDNSERDFYTREDDTIDMDHISSWAAGSTMYVVIWYDQSGLGNNAIQPVRSSQPRLILDTIPFFVGDSYDDYLYIPTPNGIQDMITAGKYGTVLSIMRPYIKSEFTFGACRGSDRWSGHILWNNSNLYFDPGYCCDTNRYYYGRGRYDKWTNYTFMRSESGAVSYTHLTLPTICSV